MTRNTEKGHEIFFFKIIAMKSRRSLTRVDLIQKALRTCARNGVKFAAHAGVNLVSKFFNETPILSPPGCFSSLYPSKQIESPKVTSRRHNQPHILVVVLTCKVAHFIKEMKHFVLQFFHYSPNPTPFSLKRVWVDETSN